ncbi:hypothetical protein ACRRTK_000919 [Alexandromys fortis]
MNDVFIGSPTHLLTPSLPVLFSHPSQRTFCSSLCIYFQKDKAIHIITLSHLLWVFAVLFG